MRLFENRGAAENDKMFIAARHGEDEARLTTELNQPLKQEAIQEVQRLGQEVAEYYLRHQEKYPDGIRLISSPRIRARQTSEIIASKLDEYGVRRQIDQAPEIEEINQGDFIVSNHQDGEIYAPLEDAWAAFILELKNGNIHYNFGDPLEQEDGSYKYKELIEFFNIFGEDEARFSVRLYSFLLKVFREERQSLNILITHQVIVSRIQKILDAASKIADPEAFTVGTFVSDMEHKGERINIGHAEGVVVKDYNYEAIGRVLERELGFLEQTIQARDDDDG